MKNPIESSVISHSQSEANSERGKSQLFNASTTKFDSLFSIFDQICLKSHIPSFFYYISTIYLYYQVFFSSLYPFNKFWFEINEDRNRYIKNSKIIKINTILENIAWFFHVEDENEDSNLSRTNGETNLMPPLIILLVIFVISLFNILIQKFGLMRLHMLRKINFYIVRFIIDIISPIMIIPTSALIGVSIRNLVLSNDKLNWIYLICGFIMYIVFLLYMYISLTIMNQSTCISMNLLSSFSIKLPLLFPAIASFFVILQCIFSLFYYWAMVIIQLSHIAICILTFYQLIYLIFHLKIANIIFIGVILSTCFNDIIFTTLHFIQPPSKNDTDSIHKKLYFFYISGYVFPLISLVISFIISAFFVNFRQEKVLKELIQLCDSEETALEISINNNDNNSDLNGQKFASLSSSKLFKSEDMALMSIHISFFNCLPIFSKGIILSYVASRIPTNRILISTVQYLSFFPGSSRKLNNVLRVISQNRDLRYHQRFLMYQVYRINMMRQSSASADANRKLTELKETSTQNYEDIISFYHLKSAKVAYLEMISSENWNVDGKWEEAIRDYPNFQKFSDEYCSFLVECQMNLPKALVMKHRSNLIEMGRNFNVDVPFISLAKNVPGYLKKGIIDFQGHFKHQRKPSKAKFYANSSNNSNNGNNNPTQPTTLSSGSTGNSGSNGMFSSSTSMLSDGYNLDPEFEESLGHQLFKHTALRLEMHRLLANRKSYASLLLLIYAYCILFGGIALFIGIYFYIDDYIIQRSDSMYYLNLASKIRFYLDLSVFGSTLKFAYYTGRFTTLDKFNELDTKDNFVNDNKGSSSGYDADMFKIDDEMSYTLIHRNLLVSKDALSDLIIHLAILSLKGESVYELAHIMMFNEIPFTMCINGLPDYDVKLSLKTLEAYMHFIVDQTAAKTVREGYWYNTDDMCEILSNQPGIESSTLQLFTSLMDYEIALCDKEDKFINVFEYAFPCVPLVLYIVPVLFFTHLFIKDTEKLIKMLLNASSDAKDSAKKPVRRDLILEVTQTSEKKPRSKHWILLKIALIVVGILIAFILYYMLSETNELNDNVKKLGRWNLLASIRMSCSVVSMNYMLTAVILNGSSSLNLTESPKAIATREKMINFCRETLIQLENSNEILLKGSEMIPTSSGFDDELDRINLHSNCEVTNNTEMHDSYRCTSCSQGVSILISMINVVLKDIEQTGGNFDHEMVLHSLHLLNRHLLGKLEQAVDRIHDINVIHCKMLKNKTMIAFVCGLIVTILAFGLVLLFYVKTISIYKIGMIFVQRFSPSTFLSDRNLMNFLLNKKDNQKESEMSTSQSVIYMSHDAVVCTNGSGIVEIINPAVTSILGYTPDQMLGQNISTFFSDSINSPQKEDANVEGSSVASVGDSVKIDNQLELMKNGQCGLVYEGHFTCITDDEKEMPCGLTILGMTDQGETNDNENRHEINVESFVFIIRDETQLAEQQKVAEEAKARSENLLFHILPRDIVARLNSGEKDISFTVQSASIIFTDVVKFSEYASNLSPQEIMGSLSTMFEAFDACAKKYELITKIKLIGDIYMAAAGLFSPDIAPKDHAEQILNFGIDCLVELEEVNLKLNSNLQLRVGINSGGPVLAGVLGTDKPVFDIIGDPINVAARLQTTDFPGKAQISKFTYDLVCDGDFCIEERGEVFLKGKGKSMAYLVSPPTHNVKLVSISSQKLE